MIRTTWASLGIVLALAAAAVVTLVYISGRGDEVTPPVASTTPEEPSIVPAWVEVPADQLLEEGGVYAIDVTSGSRWSLELSRLSAPAQLSVRFRGWSPEAEAIVELIRQVGESERSTVHVAIPGQSFSPFSHGFSFPASRFVWSPDGRLLAGSESPTGLSLPRLSVLELENGGGRLDLLELSGSANAWSADSRYLTLSNIGRGLAVLDSETGLTPQISAAQVSWSNSGARLAYVSTSAAWTDRPQLLEIRVRDFIADSDMLMATIPGFTRGGVSWSLDDSFLAVSFQDDSVPRETKTFIIDVAEQKATVAISGSISAGWSSNSNTLLFSGELCGGDDIFSVNADGSGLQNHTQSEAFDVQPRWTPDGSGAVFVSYGGGEGVVSLVEIPRGEVRELVVTGPGTIELFAWSPDGKYIVLSVGGGTGFCEATEPQTTEVDILP